MRAWVLASVLMFLLAPSIYIFAQEGTNRSALVVEVMSAAGRPIRNACVTLIPKEGEIILLKADKNGRVVFKRQSPGSYRVVVRVDGYEAQKKQVTVGSDVETIAFSLQEERRGR